MVSEILYRYMSFPEFVNMVQRNELQLISPLIWDDKYEGYLFHMIKTEEGKKRLIESSKKYTNDENEAINVLNNVIPKVRCRCWTKNCDDILMWNLYSYNKEAIMISVKRESIEKLKNIEIVDLQYDSYDINLEDEIEKVITKDGIYFLEIFKTKRKIFEYEHEVRLFSKPDTYDELISINNTYNINLDNITSFIESVIVHPCASDWYEDTVKTFCEKNKINFVGRSKIYFPFQ